MTFVWNRRAIAESSRTWRSCRELVQPAGTDFSQNSRPYIVLKLLCDPHGHASSLMQYLFVFGYSLHSHNAGFPLVRAYTHAMLALLILFTARCICYHRSKWYITSVHIRQWAELVILGTFRWNIANLAKNMWNNAVDTCLRAKISPGIHLWSLNKPMLEMI